MADLYDISFTTTKMIKRLDKRGNVISEERMATPITITALPYGVAQSYKNCDNFLCVSHVMDDGRRSSKHGWGGAATKKVDREAYAHKEQKAAKPIAAKAQKLSAAETGNLAAAVNV